jgi:hypothetical protein
MWYIHGEDAGVVADMIENMAHFLATTGLPGFVAWIEQEHEIQASAEAIRRNMEELSENIRETR